MTRPTALAVAVATSLALTGCAAGDASGAGGDRLHVTASFYPLQWAAERVAGEHAQVLPLTKPGTEPHDLELTPKAVAELAASDVVVYLSGFQPAVDEAVAQEAADTGFDVGPVADLSLAGAQGQDPHFWLDPVRVEKVATALGERFAEKDPAHAVDYRANAQALVADLRTLDAEFRTGLAQCRSRELVTGHAAFGYLAQRYGLSQEGIAGISPDAEPDAATLRDLAAHVREEGVTTVYAETLVSPALAETLARETGARIAVLDPVEGITDSSAGSDYLEVMRSNLRTLTEGQQCR